MGVGCQTTASPEPIPTHMLRLLCEGADANFLRSRIAVLDVGDPNYDYGFSTGHGVPPERPCAVKDFTGQTRSADLIHLADGYQAGERTDWAVIRFDKITTEKLVRYTLEPLEDLTRLEEAEFSFAQARGLPENAQTCKLSVLDFGNDRRKVTHDCRAVAGQSGSPLTRIVDGKHQLIGLHIGHLWMLDSPATGRPDRAGYINLLDRETIAQIESVIADNRS